MKTLSRILAAFGFVAVMALPSAPSALAYTSSWEGCVPCNQQWKEQFDPKTQDAFGAVSKDDRDIYIVTVFEKGHKDRVIHEYWMRGTCAQNVFRLTVDRKHGRLDVHDGSRGKKK